MITEENTNQAQVFTPELQAKIDAWKKQYGSVTMLTTPAGDKKAFVRPPDRKIVSMVKSVGGTDEVAVTELLLDACWLEGDEELRTDDTYFLAIMPQVQELLDLKEVVLKKL